MEFEWNAKDKAVFNFYADVVENRKTQFFIWLESDNKEVSLTDFRSDSGTYRFNNFNIIEDKISDTITFCPNIAGCPAYFRINTINSFKLSIIRKGGFLEEISAFNLGEVKLILTPVSMRKYKVEILSNENTSGTGNSKNLNQNENTKETKFSKNLPETKNLQSLTNQNTALPKNSLKTSQSAENCTFDTDNIFTGGFNSEEETLRVEEVSKQKSVAETPLLNHTEPPISQPCKVSNDTFLDTNRLQALQDEQEKDYSKYLKDFDEIKGKYKVDLDILKFYKDKDFVPVEKLIKEADDLIGKIEEQIALFVKAQQKKSDDIEKTLKVGKKE